MVSNRVDTVLDEQLGGHKDSVVVQAATDDDRMVITLDRGVGDIRNFPPGSHAGSWSYALPVKTLRRSSNWPVACSTRTSSSSGAAWRSSSRSACAPVAPMSQSRIPDGAVERVQRWADQRIPDHVRDQIRIEFDATDRTITIRECRPPWHPDMGDEWTRFRDKSSLRSIYRQRGSGRYA
jgi:hypothetical protein